MSTSSSNTSTSSPPGSAWSVSKTGTWHFHPRGPYLNYSICEQIRKAKVFYEEPQGSILCPKCIKAMKRLVAKIEAKHRDSHDDG